MKNLSQLIRQVFTDEHLNALDLPEISTQEIPIESSQVSVTPTQSVEIPQTPDQTQEDNPTNNSSQNQNLENNKEGTIMPAIPTDPQLLALYEQCLACTACELCTTAQNLVFGDGSAQAQIMVIGEAPGADEDEQGRPFVGRAGQLLIKLLNQYGLDRSEIFIANILKHRPPNNRNPLPAEITACTPFLKKQIEIIQPKLLITLGNFSSRYILNTKEGITTIRGKIRESEYGMVMPSLHPSAIIRGAYPVDLLEDDIKTALSYIGHTWEENN